MFISHAQHDHFTQIQSNRKSSDQSLVQLTIRYWHQNFTHRRCHAFLWTFFFFFFSFTRVDRRFPMKNDVIYYVCNALKSLRLSWIGWIRFFCYSKNVFCAHTNCIKCCCWPQKFSAKVCGEGDWWVSWLAFVANWSQTFQFLVVVAAVRTNRPKLLTFIDKKQMFEQLRVTSSEDEWQEYSICSVRMRVKKKTAKFWLNVLRGHNYVSE